MMIRLVIVEDDPTSLAALGRVFLSADDIKIIGAYLSAEEALRATDWREVDVLLTDLDLPRLTGPQLIAVARGNAPGLLAIAHTVHEERESLFEALRSGANGYLVKGTTVPVLLESIRAMIGGETPISSIVAGHLTTYFRNAETSSSAWDELLTSREFEVLNLFTRGCTYDEIAQSIGISRHTVHSHVRNIYRKLQVNSRKQALKQALARGYIRA
jgi:DNA-binding NarL/FixJ family response regulator